VFEDDVWEGERGYVGRHVGQCAISKDKEVARVDFQVIETRRHDVAHIWRVSLTRFSAKSFHSSVLYSHSYYENEETPSDD
jgi:hypothetical protein